MPRKKGKSAVTLPDFRIENIPSSWRRPPMYRWMKINEIPDDASLKGLDPWISKGCGFRREWSDRVPSDKLDVKYPGVREAVETFADNKPGGWRWMLEALLMTPETDKALASHIGANEAEPVITAYRKLFFDIDLYRHSPVSVSVNVLASAGNRAGVMGVSDYVWKLFAYTWGAEGFIEAVCKGTGSGLMEEQQKKWLAATIQQENMFRAASAVKEIQAGWSEQAARTLEDTKESWTKIGTTATEDIFARYLDELLALKLVNVVTERKQLPEGGTGAEEKRSGVNECEAHLIG